MTYPYAEGEEIFPPISAENFTMPPHNYNGQDYTLMPAAYWTQHPGGQVEAQGRNHYIGFESRSDQNSSCFVKTFLRNTGSYFLPMNSTNGYPTLITHHDSGYYVSQDTGYSGQYSYLSRTPVEHRMAAFRELVVEAPASPRKNFNELESHSL